MAWAHISGQNAGNQGGASTTALSATYPNPVGVGHFLVCGWATLAANSTPVSSSIADSHGNTWALLNTSGVGANSEFQTFAFYGLVVPGGSALALQVTVTATANYSNMFIDEFSFTGGAPTFDAASSFASASTTPTTGSIAVAGSGPDLVLGMEGSYDTGGDSHTVGNGTLIYSDNTITGTQLGFCSEYVLNAVSATNLAFNLSPTGNWRASGISMKIVASSITYTLTGPSSGAVNSPSTNFTLTPSGSVTSDTITFSAASGTFTPTSLTFTNSSAAQTFTYTPASSGVKSLTLTSADSSTITGSPASYTATAVGFTMTGPTSGAVGVASTNFTVTPASATNDTFTPSTTGGGTFTPTSLTFTTGSTSAQTFTYTPASSGSKSIVGTSSDGGTVTGSPISYTATAVNYTLTGPTSGSTGVASTNFTLTPASTVTDTITLSAGAGGGTFSPTSLTFTASSTAQTFTYTPATSGTKTLTLTSADGGSITGSPATYTASGTSVGYTLTGPTSGTNGVASTNFTLTPASTVTSDTITLSASSGTFTPSSLTFTNSSAAQTFTYTPASTGVKSLTVTSTDGGSIPQSPWSYTSNASAVTRYNIGGAASGTINIPSAAVTLTPNGMVANDIVRYSSSNTSAVFNPASPQTINNSSSAISFTYTGNIADIDSITFSSSSGLAFSINPLAFTVHAVAAFIPFDTVITLPNYLSGYASTATVAGLAWNGTSYANIATGSESIGPIYENASVQPAQYSCRIGLNSSVIPPLTVPRFAWNVNGVLVVDSDPSPCSVVSEPGVTPAQALAMCFNMLCSVASGINSLVPAAGQVNFADINNTTTRASIEFDEFNNRTATSINPPTL